jgi:predicted cupin superfamily sugar epimerase
LTTAEEIIDFFDMKPLAGEGGYFVETYRSGEKTSGGRNLATAILYLITPEACSKLHRLSSDEVWHFYLGDAVTMLELYADGSSEVFTLGRDIANGQQLQVAVPAKNWQGCFLNEGGKFALMGCTVAPGFEFEDFEPGEREKLLEKYPDQQELIVKLTQ